MKNRRRTQHSKKQRNYHLKAQNMRIDFGLLAAFITLLAVGVIMVYEASVVEAFTNYSDKLYFAKLQFRWAVAGLAVLFITTYTPLKLIKQLAVVGLVGSLFFLFMVLIPGVGTKVGGASRWLNLGFFSFQPSELVKLSLVVYFSALFEKSIKLTPFLFVLGLSLATIMLQPDLGTTIVIAAISFTLYYAAGAPVLTIAMSAISAISAGALLILSSPYRRQRLLTFLDPEQDPLGTSYHIRQIIISLGSGGVLGTGLGKSLQKYRYLPEATTDSIFAIIAEETGFFGTSLLFGLFMFVAFRGLTIASKANNVFARLVAVGCTSLIIYQAFINLSAMAALVPLTGITLPFISYGGSSLITSLAAAGLILNVSKYQNQRS